MGSARATEILRGGLWALAAAASAAFAAGYSLRAAERNLEGRAGAHAFAGDGIVRLRAILGDAAEGRPGSVSSADAAAIQTTLREQPLNSRALAVLAVRAANQTGAEEAGSPLMKLADGVSRREAVSQVWMIEAASAAGDVEATVRHYHAALSVRPEMGGVLFPILVGAMDFPEVRDALRGYVIRADRWVPDFLAEAANTADLDSLVSLVSPPPPSFRAKPLGAFNATLVYRLAAAGRKLEARQYAEATLPGVSGEAFDQFGVASHTLDERLGLLAWRLTDGETVNATAAADGVVSADIQPTASGVVMARDMIVTAGGHYEFRQTISRTDIPAPSSLRWQASCDAPEGGGGVVWSQIVPTADRPVQYVSRFSVPANCNIMKFELMAVGPDAQVPASLQISGLSLRPVGR